MFSSAKVQKITDICKRIHKKNNDVFSAMENTLIENCPVGFGVNPKALKGIAKGLIKIMANKTKLNISSLRKMLFAGCLQVVCK